MIIEKDDARFWDLRTVERRIARGELTRADLEQHLAGLADATEKSTESKPLEEPDDRPRERRPAVRVTGVPGRGAESSLDDDSIDDDDDLDFDDDDDDLDDEDE